MELSDICPQPAKITLKDSQNNVIELVLRPFTLMDEVGLMGIVGGGDLAETGLKVAEIFQEVNIEKICEIAWQQLDVESKKTLLSYNFADIDDSGKEVNLAPRGWQKLSRMLTTAQDFHNLVNALLLTRGISEPILEEIEKLQASSDNKKKV